MTVTKTKNNNELTVKISGRLDTVTSPELESSLNGEFEGLEKLTFDFAELEYLSSAGLRILLTCRKKMNDQGAMVVTNVNSTIKEIFDITGFSDLLNIV